MAKRIFERYPWPDPEPSDYRDWFSVLGSDFVIDCPTRNVSNIYAAHGLDTYFYNFNHSWEVPGLWGPNMTFCEGHSCHGGELPFEFSSANKSGAKLLPDENVLAASMTQIWSAFAATGNPNGDGAPNWPLYGNFDIILVHLTRVCQPSTPPLAPCAVFCLVSILTGCGLVLAI